jgi:DNA-directed RNA polymerase subunit RPC12/RpoP
LKEPIDKTPETVNANEKPQSNSKLQAGATVETNPISWTTSCSSCHAKITLPRKTPPFGTALVCPTCKAPIQTVHKDSEGSLVGWNPHQVDMIFGYQTCSIEHPRCPWCSKIVYAVVFPERGRDVPWYAVREQQNPMANFTVPVACPNCSSTFIIEWEGWPFQFKSQKQCCFCGLVVIGDDQPMAIPEDKREQFEVNLDRKASRMAYLHDESGKPLWYACPNCMKTALNAFDAKQGTDPAQANSLGFGFLEIPDFSGLRKDHVQLPGAV